MEIKKDHYRAVRGDYSEIITLHCASCGERIGTYQKDGPGYLYRGYIDRFHTLENVNLTALQVIDRIDALPALVCHGCGKALGDAMVYEPEQRLAWRFAPGAIDKYTQDGEKYEPTEYIPHP